MEKELHSFKDFNLNPQLYNALEANNLIIPTEIQRKVIPQVLSGQDIIGIAQTGTGKTAAFALPILRKLNYAQGDDARALILAPTRELAKQISDHVKMLGENTSLRVVCAYGGTGIKPQVDAILAGVDIIVATPGRFLDLNKEGCINGKKLSTIVLDEADKMMDMGFMPQLRKVQEIIPMKRQNLLFSATFPQKVEHLAEEFLDFPNKIEVTPESTPVETVRQLVYHTPNLRAKIDLLAHLYEKDEAMKKILIFTRTKTTADNVYKFFHRKLNENVRVIHSNKGQNTRLNAIKDFSEGDIEVLVATDISARGIDVKDITHVINFEVPLLYEDYIHRIGRTGRAGKKGIAITFANESESMHVNNIEKLIKMKLHHRKMPDDIKIQETPFDEKQDIARDIDIQKRKADPDFKGAFHEKKRKFPKPSKNKKTGGKGSNNKGGKPKGKR